jgi:hypothetical protein
MRESLKQSDDDIDILKAYLKTQREVFQLRLG